jgi:hypothetical protein
VPVAAAVKTEVLAGDAHPLEVLRGGEHPPDQRPVLVLDPAPLDQRLPCIGDAVGEPVAQRLQLPEIEQPRRGDGRLDAVRHLGVAEGLAEESGQLRLELGDLPAQLRPRPALVDREVEPAEPLLSE